MIPVAITATFDIKKDIEIVNAGGFFCQGCIVGRPASEQSPDPRYCKSCYEIIRAAGQGDKQGEVSDAGETAQAADGGVSKIGDGKNTIDNVSESTQSNYETERRPRGRPRKSGEYSRATFYRRKKEAREPEETQTQGVLLLT